MGEVRVLVDPKALRRAKDRLRALTSRRWGVSMERRIDAINRFTVGMDSLFQAGRHPDPVRGPRRMAQTPTTASAMEGMETRAHPTAQTTRPRYLRDERPTMGDFAQGVLAHRGIQSPLHRLAQRLLDQTGPAGIPRPLPPFPGRDANRQMRTRMSGGVGGAGVSPAPTRSIAELASNRPKSPVARSISPGSRARVVPGARQGARARRQRVSAPLRPAAWLMVGHRHDPAARDRARADPDPVALETERPRLEAERLDAPQLKRVGDLLGAAMDDHVAADVGRLGRCRRSRMPPLPCKAGRTAWTRTRSGSAPTATVRRTRS